ncbi:MAG: hypothetical protein NC827_08550 [Candidatus Omnitrophica bacterium]|nr:hypothetical protein [Candidatus Omnitrophota bacterium]
MAELTKFLFKAIIRKFYKWLKQADYFPPEVKWIKLRLKNNNHRLPEEMLTEGKIKNVQFDEYGAVLIVNGKNRS